MDLALRLILLCVAVSTTSSGEVEQQASDFYYFEINCDQNPPIIKLAQDITSTDVYDLSKCRPSDDLCTSKCNPDRADRLKVIHSLVLLPVTDRPGFSSSQTALWEKAVSANCRGYVYPGRVVAWSSACSQESQGGGNVCWSDLPISDVGKQSLMYDPGTVSCAAHALFSFSELFGQGSWSSFPSIMGMGQGDRIVIALAFIHVYVLMILGFTWTGLWVRRALRLRVGAISTDRNTHYVTINGVELHFPLPSRTRKATAHAALIRGGGVRLQVVSMSRMAMKSDYTYVFQGICVDSGWRSERDLIVYPSRYIFWRSGLESCPAYYPDEVPLDTVENESDEETVLAIPPAAVPKRVYVT